MKSFSNLNEIWRLDMERWVPHKGMLYDQIQGQGQGHEDLEVATMANFKVYFLRPTMVCMQSVYLFPLFRPKFWMYPFE